MRDAAGERPSGPTAARRRKAPRWPAVADRLAVGGLLGLLVVVFLGIALDTYRLSAARASSQRAAVEAALSAAAELPDREAATAAALDHVVRAVPGSTVEVAFGTSGPADESVTVTVRRVVQHARLRLLGAGSTTVRVSATAHATSTGGFATSSPQDVSPVGLAGPRPTHALRHCLGRPLDGGAAPFPPARTAGRVRALTPLPGHA